MVRFGIYISLGHNAQSYSDYNDDRPNNYWNIRLRRVAAVKYTMAIEITDTVTKSVLSRCVFYIHIDGSFVRGRARIGWNIIDIHGTLHVYMAIVQVQFPSTECLHVNVWLFAQPFVQEQKKKTSNLRVIGLCEGNPPVIGGKYCHLMTSSCSVDLSKTSVSQSMTGTPPTPRITWCEPPCGTSLTHIWYGYEYDETALNTTWPDPTWTLRGEAGIFESIFVKYYQWHIICLCT